MVLLKENNRITITPYVTYGIIIVNTAVKTAHILQEIKSLDIQKQQY